MRPWIDDRERARRFTKAPCTVCGGTAYSPTSAGHCTSCDGTGLQPKSEAELCRSCRGRSTQCFACLGSGRPHVRCEACRGNGAIGGLVCAECSGRRVLDLVVDARTIDVQHERAAALAAGVPASLPAVLDPAFAIEAQPEPAPASEDAGDETAVVYDEDALRSMDEAWRAAEGPQRRALPGRRAA